MQESKPSKKIIDRIKQERITPAPRWKLEWKNYLFWAVLTGMVVLAVLFFSLILLSTLDIGLDFYRQFRLMRLVRVLIVTAPVLWIVLFGLALVFGLLAFRSTKRGYRYSVMFVSSVLVLVVSVLGALAHIARINNQIELAFERRGPLWGMKVMPTRQRLFFRPDEGFLAGMIMGAEERVIFLRTPVDEDWTVHYDETTHKMRNLELETGVRVIVVGDKTGEHIFKAKFIRPVGRDGGRMPVQPQGPGSGIRSHGPGPMLPTGPMGH